MYNFEEQIICEFCVTSEQKHINYVYLELLKEFEKLCKKQNITYYVSYGALIGAIRHKGFIPWDDDVDILVPRPDFNKLAEMSNEEFGAVFPFFLQTPKNDPQYGDLAIRFRKSDTAFFTSDDVQVLKRNEYKPQYNLGISISIMPLDAFPRHIMGQKLQLFFTKGLGSLIYRYNLRAGRFVPLKIACIAIGKVVGAKNLSKIFHSFYSVYNIEKADKVQSFEGHYRAHTLWDRELYEKVIYVPFEDITIPVPAGYDRILRETYGNYMEFPPEEKRIGKHAYYVSWSESYIDAAKKLRDGSIKI